MQLEINCFADIKIRGLSKAKIYIKEVRPEERRYAALVIDGPNTGRTVWLREKSIEEIFGKPKQAPADIRSWPHDAAAAFLLDEFQTIGHFSKERFSTQLKQLDLHAWSEYCVYIDKLRVMYSHNKERAHLVKALLSLRPTLRARRILPGEKIVSRSVRRKVRLKERMRGDYSRQAPRPERMVGYNFYGPNQPLEDPTLGLRHTLRRKKRKKSETPGSALPKIDKTWQFTVQKKPTKTRVGITVAPLDDEEPFEPDVPF